MSERPEHATAWSPFGPADAARERDRVEPEDAIESTAEPEDEVRAEEARPGSQRPDPRRRPPDPAGTQPKFEPESLLPKQRGGIRLLASGTATASAAHGTGDGDLLPQLRDQGGALGPTLPIEAPHASRFQFLLGALIALGVAAVAITAGLLLAPGPAPAPAWSSWHPSGGSDPVKQIATHVATEYRLDSGDQLVAIDGGPLAVQGVPVKVALSDSTGNESLLDGTGVLYDMCGIGANCSIAHGAPSAQRLLLLRREALELALYTFKYVDGVNQVVVLMPPPPASVKSKTASSQATKLALFFRPSDVGAELSRPLQLTLGGPTPSVSTVTSSPNVELVNKVTSSSLYQFSVTQDQAAGPILLLQPPA